MYGYARFLSNTIQTVFLTIVLLGVSQRSISFGQRSAIMTWEVRHAGGSSQKKKIAPTYFGVDHTAHDGLAA